MHRHHWTSTAHRSMPMELIHPGSRCEHDKRRIEQHAGPGLHLCKNASEVLLVVAGEVAVRLGSSHLQGEVGASIGTCRQARCLVSYGLDCRHCSMRLPTARESLAGMVQWDVQSSSTLADAGVSLPSTKDPRHTPRKQVHSSCMHRNSCTPPNTSQGSFNHETSSRSFLSVKLLSSAAKQ